MAISQIHIKNLVGEHNRFLDSTLEKVRFNFDHVFHIPKTIRSLVFFPYHIDVSQVDKLNKYCNENGKWVDELSEDDLNKFSEDKDRFSEQIVNFKAEQKKQGLDIENNLSCNIAGWAIGKEHIDLLELIPSGMIELREAMQAVCDLPDLPDLPSE